MNECIDLSTLKVDPLRKTFDELEKEEIGESKPEESKIAKSKPTISFEQQFGERLPVWVGGIALAGLFLVKYSLENNLLNPTVRVILNGVLGSVLLYAAEHLILLMGFVLDNLFQGLELLYFMSHSLQLPVFITSCLTYLVFWITSNIFTISNHDVFLGNLVLQDFS